MRSTLGAIAFALQLGTSWAAPTAQSFYWCVDTYDYTNDDGGHTVAGTPFNGGVLCDGDGDCTMSLTETYTVSTSVTIGTSFSLDFAEIITAGVDLSVTQTTGTAIGEGGTVKCPLGAWECSMKVTPWMVQVTGNVAHGNPCEGDSTEPYDVTFPHIDASNNAIISVETCACPDFEGWADAGAPPPCPGPCK